MHPLLKSGAFLSGRLCLTREAPQASTRTQAREAGSPQIKLSMRLLGKISSSIPNRTKYDNMKKGMNTPLYNKWVDPNPNFMGGLPMS